MSCQAAVAGMQIINIWTTAEHHCGVCVVQVSLWSGQQILGPDLSIIRILDFRVALHPKVRLSVSLSVCKTDRQKDGHYQFLKSLSRLKMSLNLMSLIGVGRVGLRPNSDNVTNFTLFRCDSISRSWACRSVSESVVMIFEN